MKTQYRLNNVELISISNNSWYINMVLLLLLKNIPYIMTYFNKAS